MGNLPKTMKAWQKHFGSTEPQLVEVPVPQAPPDGLLIKILAAGVCHSDVALLNAPAQTPGWPNEKYTLGHEGCGEIIEIGSSVTDDFKLGDIVAIISLPGCKDRSGCSECSRGLTQICQKCERYGIGWDGSYAPFIAVKAWSAIKLPDGVSAEAGAVATDACMTAYHAVVGTGAVKKEHTIIIQGLGGLGFNALQIVQSIGARVIVTDRRQEVLDEAVLFGVPKDDVVPIGESIVDFVKQHDLVVDTVIDFVGVQDTFLAGQEAVRLGGKLVQVGLLAPEITIGNYLALRKHLTILCSYGGTMEDLGQCLALIAAGKLRPQVVKGNLSQFPRVLEDLHAGKVKSRIALVPN